MRSTTAALLLVLGACHTASVKVEDARLPLLTAAPATRTTRVVGRLAIRRVQTMSGCTTPGTDNLWAVLEADGHTLPLRSVSDDELTAIGHDPQRALTSSAPLWTADELARRHLQSGALVTVEGLVAPLFYSGTVALMPVYGVCVTRVAAAR